MKARFLLPLLAVGFLRAASAAPLTESTFTEVIRDVNVVAATTKAATPARTNVIFKVPDMVRTGPASRVELTAPDQTITRIGSDTIFSFEPEARTINLQRGSILFHTPAGKGGGSITSGGASAAVLGTTLLCAILHDGSFKTIVLEGKGRVTLPDGRYVDLKAGQMVVVSPDRKKFSVVLYVDLARLVSHLLLIVGFSQPPSSMPLIDAAIQEQQGEIDDGTAGPFAPWPEVTDGLDVIGGASGVVESSDHTTIRISPGTGAR